MSALAIFASIQVFTWRQRRLSVAPFAGQHCLICAQLFTIRQHIAVRVFCEGGNCDGNGG
jgi:hypothetical protein